jgi:ATP-dependent Clp protease ATP-binding subunit ClpB
LGSLRAHFRPEFLNRIDEIILFHPLQRDQIHKIVEFQIARLKAQLLSSGIALEVSPSAIAAIAAEGYDPTYGARPIKRLIQQKIQNLLAVEVLRQRVSEGTRVWVDYVDGEFTFERADAPVPAASGMRVGHGEERLTPRREGAKNPPKK